MKEVMLAKLSTMVTMVRAFSLGFIVFVDNTRPLLGFFSFSLEAGSGFKRNLLKFDSR